jgi:lysine 2,3-aminomutase
MASTPETGTARSLIDDDSRAKPTVADVLPAAAAHGELADLADIPIPAPLKATVAADELTHRQFDDSEFWRSIPAFAELSRDEFLDYKFQNKQSVTKVEKLAELLQGIVSETFLEDVRQGMKRAPMNVRISPYILSLIDWEDPYHDPLRTQFLPVGSRLRPDHPYLTLDSLHEQDDSPVPGLVHRYPDKTLFLALGVCPVYCRFCTRSYAIGGDTETVEKVAYSPDPKRWRQAFAYLASRPEVEDVVISGGDAFFLSPNNLKRIGRTLLAIPHIRRIRFASKGPAVAPMKILTHDKWTEALVEISDLGRELGKEVALHTHFNSPNEITAISRQAMQRLYAAGVRVRNQSVLIRGVNDGPDVMTELVRKLSYLNVQPYYVYQHDMVRGVEDLRTRIADTKEIERRVRGATAGFNTPTFVCDVPGGGGKRAIHSHDHYDPVYGVGVYRSPVVDEERCYLYFDPIHLLPPEGRERWKDPKEHRTIVTDVLREAGMEDLQPATTR